MLDNVRHHIQRTRKANAVVTALFGQNLPGSVA